MWFKYSKEFKNSRVVKRCQSSTGIGDSCKCQRFCILLEILSESVNGAYWNNAKEFASFMGFPLKQSEIVWNICMDEVVLRPTVLGGYSANAWLKEQNMIGEIPTTPKFTPSKNSFFC